MNLLGNEAGFPLLSLITWLPLVGCGVIMAVRGDEATIASNARWTALWTLRAWPPAPPISIPC